MNTEMYDKICRMVEADIEELVAKGSLEPQEYKCLGEAIDIVKDIKKIKQIGMEMPEEESMNSYGMSGRVPYMNVRYSNENQQGSQYNPNRSPITGRYTSRDDASYHDMDGSMKKDLEELLSKAKDDHERMLIMRVLSKLDQ